MKKKITLLLGLCLLASAHLFAQQRTTGKQGLNNSRNYRVTQPNRNLRVPNRNVNPYNNQRYDVVREMDNRSFALALETIQNEFFSSTQLSIAKVVVNGNWLTTYQIKSIMDMFFFESTKLEFAKYAYEKCVDPGNYITLLNSFFFSSSKEDLMKHIAYR